MQFIPVAIKRLLLLLQLLRIILLPVLFLAKAAIIILSPSQSHWSAWGCAAGVSTTYNAHTTRNLPGNVIIIIWWWTDQIVCKKKSRHRVIKESGGNLCQGPFPAPPSAYSFAVVRCECGRTNCCCYCCFCCVVLWGGRPLHGNKWNIITHGWREI